MINVLRISVCDSIVVENVDILSNQEQIERNVPNLFEDGQICYRDVHNQIYISDDDMVSIIILRKAKPTKDFLRVKRISVTWDQLTFAPAWILPFKKFDQYKVPLIFTNVKQFCFIADDYLCLTKDDRVGRVEL